MMPIAEPVGTERDTSSRASNVSRVHQFGKSRRSPASNGGGVIFDYNVPPASLAAVQRAAFEALAARVAAAGESFRGFFEPGALVAAMRAMGFHGVRDLGPDELNASFLSNRADGLRVGSVGHILLALAEEDRPRPLASRSRFART